MSEKILPDMAKTKNTALHEQPSFGGLCRRPGAGGDALYDMRNMMPAVGGGIKTRAPHRRYVSTEAIEGIGRGLCVHGGHLMLAKGHALYRISGMDRPEEVCRVTDTDKRFASIGEWLFVFPDRICMDRSGTICRSADIDTGEISVQISEADLIRSDGDWASEGFYVGDGVTVACEGQPSNSGIYRIKAIQGGTLTLDRRLAVNGACTVSLSCTMPYIEYICVVGDRLMGCHGNTVWISEAGNPFNWYFTTGLGASAPTRISLVGEGDFTGCVCWQGYGLFFKEDRIYKLMGSTAEGYYLSEVVAPGVTAVATDTLAILGGALYYRSVADVYRYEGGYPTAVSLEAIGGSPRFYCAATDGNYYYLAGQEEAEAPCLYILDPTRNAWYQADDSLYFRSMVTMGNRVYGMTHAGDIWQIGNDWEPFHTGICESTLRGALPSSLTFGHEPCRLPQRRRLCRISLCVDAICDDPSDPPTMTVSIAYDQDESWQEIGRFQGTVDHGLLDCRLIPRACDFYRLRLEMMGAWQIHALYRLYED